MGYNATVVVMVDALHEIENDPEFGKRLAAAIRRQSSYAAISRHGTDVRAGNHGNAATVLEVQHADIISIMAIGANTGRRIGVSHWQATDEEIIKSLKRK